MDTDGVVYEYYTTAQNRIKHLTNGSGAAARWMLRTSLKGETSFGSSTYWFAQEVTIMEIHPRHKYMRMVYNPVSVLVSVSVNQQHNYLGTIMVPRLFSHDYNIVTESMA